MHSCKAGQLLFLAAVAWFDHHVCTDRAPPSVAVVPLRRSQLRSGVGVSGVIHSSTH